MADTMVECLVAWRERLTVERKVASKVVESARKTAEWKADMTAHLMVEYWADSSAAKMVESRVAELV